MTHKPDASHATRREFIRSSAMLVAGTAAMGFLAPAVHAAEDNTIRLALIGCGGRGTGPSPSPQDERPRPDQALRDGRSARSAMESRLKALKKKFRRPDRRDAGPEVPRLRRLQAGDRRASPGRRRHVHDPGLHPAGARRVRGQEGHQRLHGEAVRARSRWACTGCSRRRGGRQEGREDRRRSAMPPFAGPGRPDRQDQQRRDGRTLLHPRQPPDRPPLDGRPGRAVQRPDRAARVRQDPTCSGSAPGTWSTT